MTTPRNEWPALIKLRSISSRQNLPLDQMLQRCGSAEAACAAPAEVWLQVCGFLPKSSRLGPEADRRAEEAAEVLERLDAFVLDVRQTDYPAALRALPQPPPVLFVRGRRELLDRPSLAVVGTRQYSIYGRDATVSFVVGLVRAGYVIVSGLARGIDSVAHQTALEVGGETIAVLGSGLDVAYPAEHHDLAEMIAEHGCLLSEFPPGTRPRKHHFPQRNRIISGLARALLVVEAAERSGALITAQYALEEGKEIFAVPGPIHNPTSRGTNRLIQDGAALVMSVADLLHVLEARTGEPLPEPLARGLDVDALADRLDVEFEPQATELARRLWAALSREPKDFEELAAHLGAPANALATALLELELAGLIEKLPGAHYVQAPQRPSIFAHELPEASGV